MHQAPEEQLVHRVHAGDRGALAELFELYQQRLFNVALWMLGRPDDAAEVAQDAMLKIIEHIGDYRGDSAIGIWMIRMVMHLSVARLHQPRPRLTAASHDSMEDQGSALRQQAAHPGPGSQLTAPQDEADARLHESLRQLDEEFRAVLVLRDIDELDHWQIAQVLTLPLATVKSRLFRARLALQQITHESESL
jgi:RNA polymerase sigma-70 factor (ECF subfamily)